VRPDGDQRQQILQLVNLADIDRRRADAQRLIDSVPRVLASRQRGSHQAEAALQASKDKLQGFQKHLKTLELDLAVREQALAKANGNLMSAKTNQEYSLMMGEIGRRKEEKSEAEEKILEQYEVLKQGEQMVKDAEARLVEARKDYGAFESRAQAELDEHQKELSALDERREQVRRAIKPDVLKIYDRAYSAHGTGLAAAENNICQGCFSSLLPNDRSRLISGRETVICRSCQRILYLPEVLQAAPQ
jgi:hypothetical protein